MATPLRLVITSAAITMRCVACKSVAAARYASLRLGLDRSTCRSAPRAMPPPTKSASTCMAIIAVGSQVLAE
ncbi:MAG: hypothetical protein EBV77_04255 [Gemmatimonadaceae bacterium]|nr:hypothetical protein [Gemmatimonadaceae bacterium]